MPRGGAREGAGRPKGAATTKTREIADRALESGLTPLEYMLQVLRDDTNDMPTRMDAAKAAAAYVHPKLANVAHSGEDGGPLKIEIIKRVYGDGSAPG